MITIVDVGISNLHSVKTKVESLGHVALTARTPQEVLSAKKLLLPGVGHFAEGMKNVRAAGLEGPLTEAVMERGIPILGICLGMQLMTSYSEEGDCEGLGWVKARSTRFPVPADRSERVPHVGWNEVARKRQSVLFEDIPADSRFYFTHSYCVTCEHEEDVVATTTYIREFVSVFTHANVYGAQFHPEKSHGHGLKLVDNFVRHA